MVSYLVDVVAGVVVIAGGILDHWVDVTTDPGTELYTILDARPTEAGADLTSTLASLFQYASQTFLYVFKGLAAVGDIVD